MSYKTNKISTKIKLGWDLALGRSVVCGVTGWPHLCLETRGPVNGEGGSFTTSTLSPVLVCNAPGSAFWVA